MALPGASPTFAVGERFLREPFVKKDRIDDTMESLEKMRTPTRGGEMNRRQPHPVPRDDRQPRLPD